MFHDTGVHERIIRHACPLNRPSLIKPDEDKKKEKTLYHRFSGFDAGQPVGESTESATARFSLPQAIDYALAHNEQVKNAALEEEIAERKVSEI